MVGAPLYNNWGGSGPPPPGGDPDGEGCLPRSPPWVPLHLYGGWSQMEEHVPLLLQQPPAVGLVAKRAAAVCPPPLRSHGA